MTLYRNDSQNSDPAAKTSKYETPFFLWGLIPGLKVLSEAEMCPNSRMAAASLGMTTGDVMIGIVTLGLYVPSRVIVSCAK